MKLKIDEAVWQDYDSGDQISEKLKILKEWIPTDVKSIIDIGCGNGIICNALAKKYEVTGIDISQTALSYVQTHKILASATSIPIADASYDLVFSSEMLEHLTDQELKEAIREMSRLAKKYLIISVPNGEKLSKSMVKCAVCGNIYHAYGHLHSFSKADLIKLFPDYKCIKELCFGPVDLPYNSVLLWIKEHLAGQYFHPSAVVNCPQCQKSAFVKRSNLLSKACNFLNPLVSIAKPYWLMLMFRKEITP